MTAAGIEALVILGAKYGPQIVLDIEALFKKSDPTISDVAAIFAKVKPYGAYGIPDVAPGPQMATLAPPPNT